MKVKAVWLWGVLLFVSGVVWAVKLNSLAPEFKLMSTRHTMRSLKDYKGKVVLINFWASWCGPCKVELPELSRLAAEYDRKPVRVIAINVDEDRQAAQELLAQLKGGTSKMDILLDRRSTVVKSYDIEAMPSSFIVDQRGIIRYIHVGFRPSDTDLWRREINDLLK